MSTDISTIFAGILSQAAATKADTGQTAAYARRLSGAGTGTVILADVSSSMGESAGSRRKIDILQAALDQVLPGVPGCRLLAFSSIAAEVGSGHALPAPSGGTAMHLALEQAVPLQPRRTLVLSDGQPDDENAALAAAGRVSGIIDVIYCGPDSDRAAIAFMRKLARTGCGRYIHHDLSGGIPALTAGIRQVLTLPAGEPAR